jgi:hypothetical protein
MANCHGSAAANVCRFFMQRRIDMLWWQLKFPPIPFSLLSETFCDFGCERQFLLCAHQRKLLIGGGIPDS